jgi:serine/threonine protein kinase
MQDIVLSRDKLEAASGQKFIADKKEYLLAGMIGDGAIGVVRKARESESQKLVAVKFLAPEIKYIELSSLNDIFIRFKREGQRGAALFQEHLVKIIAYEENINGSAFIGGGPNNPFIVMEYINGTTLENYIRKRIHNNNGDSMSRGGSASSSVQRNVV